MLYQGPSFYLITLFTFVIIASFQDSFSFHTVCLSKDVTGRCSFYCFALPRPLFLPDFPLFLSRASLLGFLLRFLSQCVCPKTWQVLCFPLSILFFVLSPPSLFFVCAVCLSKDVTGTLFPSLFHLLAPFLVSTALFWLRSVSVQRRDRCSATPPTHLISAQVFRFLFHSRFVFVFTTFCANNLK